MSRKIPYKDIMNRIKDDVDYIADEAYTKGYTDGRKQAKTQAELDVAHDIKNVAKENYQKGLEDAWECARKLLEMTAYCKEELFHECLIEHIIHDYSASETLWRIKAYEENKVQIGDEVEGMDDHKRAFVIFPNGDNSKAGVIDANGLFMWWTKTAFIKTGRHFDEVKILLEKMREEK